MMTNPPKPRGEEATIPPVPASPVAEKKAKKKRKWLKWVIIAAVVLLAAAVGLRVVRNARGRTAGAEQSPGYTLATATRGNIVVSMSGSGTLRPADSYTVTGVVAGEILEAPFEEGDVLEEGAVMYRIDPSDAYDAIRAAEEEVENAKDSLEKQKRNYETLLEEQEEHNQERAETLAKLNVSASHKGQIIELMVEEGDSVTANTPVAALRDDSVLLLTVPFLEQDAKAISPGDTASVALSEYMSTLSARVDSVSSVSNIGAQGARTRNVTLSLENPGVVAAGTSAVVEIQGRSCCEAGILSYITDITIMAGVSGTVESIRVEEGDSVRAGEIILSLEETKDNANYETQIEQALESIESAEKTLSKREESLESANKKLDDYIITAPINGTVVDKSYKAGDTISTMTDLAVLYDLSSLTFTMDIDELDISKMEVGQTAVITADAVEGRIYTGEVTRISVQGSTSNGVTSYPVTVSLNETEGLLPFMNVSVQINVTERLQVLTIPAAAVSRGNRVLLQTDPNADPNAAVEEGGETPAGFAYTEVRLGETDGTNIEILNGLEEGDVVAYSAAIASSDFSGMMVGGGMMFPAGGMGGSAEFTMPAGGMGDRASGGMGGNRTSGGMGGGGNR